MSSINEVFGSKAKKELTGAAAAAITASAYGKVSQHAQFVCDVFCGKSDISVDSSWIWAYTLCLKDKLCEKDWQNFRDQITKRARNVHKLKLKLSLVNQTCTLDTLADAPEKPKQLPIEVQAPGASTSAHETYTGKGADLAKLYLALSAQERKSFQEMAGLTEAPAVEAQSK